jgi:hypothetical protein
VTTTLQQPVGSGDKRPSATDEHPLPSTTGSITVELLQENVASGAQGGKVSRRSTAVRVGSPDGSAERSP